MTPEGEQLSIWFKQAWDTATSYHRFKTYYLEQDAPRSLVQAYRNWYSKQHGISAEQARKIEQTGGAWNHWANGRTSGGVQLEGALTWKERAEAYDLMLQREYEEAKQMRRLRTSQLMDERLLSAGLKWDDMFKAAQLLKKTGIKRVPIQYADSEGNIVTDYKEIETRGLAVTDLNSLIATLEKLRQMERLELGLPQRISQSRLSDNEGNDTDIMGGGLIDLMAGVLQSLDLKDIEDELNEGEGDDETK